MGYLGSKAASGAYQVLISSMPPHDTYVETCVGSGVIFRRKPRAATSFLIDMDEDCVRPFQGLEGVHAIHGSLFDFLEGFDFKAWGRVLVYIDPPYLLETRTSDKRYRYEFSREDHVRLLALLRRLPALVLLSAYPSALYAEMLSDWRRLEYQVMTRGGPRSEHLYMNFDEGTSAAWSTYAGRGFTDRQRIKRKAARWARDFAALGPGERTAVMAALLETMAEPGQLK